MRDDNVSSWREQPRRSKAFLRHSLNHGRWMWLSLRRRIVSMVSETQNKRRRILLYETGHGYWGLFFAGKEQEETCFGILSFDLVTVPWWREVSMTKRVMSWNTRRPLELSVRILDFLGGNKRPILRSERGVSWISWLLEESSWWRRYGSDQPDKLLKFWRPSGFGPSLEGKIRSLSVDHTTWSPDCLKVTKDRNFLIARIWTR